MLCLVAGGAIRDKVLKGIHECFIVRLAQLMDMVNLKAFLGSTVLAATIALLGSLLSLFPRPRVACPVAAFPATKALVGLVCREFVFAVGTAVDEHEYSILAFLSSVKSLIETDSQLGTGH